MLRVAAVVVAAALGVAYGQAVNAGTSGAVSGWLGVVFYRADIKSFRFHFTSFRACTCTHTMPFCALLPQHCESAHDTRPWLLCV